jgi:hypothetical protein
MAALPVGHFKAVNALAGCYWGPYHRYWCGGDWPIPSSLGRRLIGPGPTPPLPLPVQDMSSLVMLRRAIAVQCSPARCCAVQLDPCSRCRAHAVTEGRGSGWQWLDGGMEGWRAAQPNNRQVGAQIACVDLSRWYQDHQNPMDQRSRVEFRSLSSAVSEAGFFFFFFNS